MFYEDQHKLAAYLERTGAEWEVKHGSGGWAQSTSIPSTFTTAKNFHIRPVLRYGLPSHLLYQSHNPDGLTEEQICEGGKYRATVIGERGREGFQWWDEEHGRWIVRHSSVGTLIGIEGLHTFRLPATVPWPDWEATQPDPKDARIAELEMQDANIGCHYCNHLLDASIVPGIYECPRCIEQFKNAPHGGNTVSSMVTRINELEAQLAASPWRPMSEVPTEEDADEYGYVLAITAKGKHALIHFRAVKESAYYVAWMPAPKFHGWPDPLTDLLKAHGVAVTPELAVALNAWKGVEK